MDIEGGNEDVTVEEDGGLDQDKEKAIRAIIRYYDALYFKDCTIMTEEERSKAPSKNDFESLIGFLHMVNEQEIHDGCKRLVAEHFEKMVKWFYRVFMQCEERPTPVRVNNTDVCLLDLYLTVKGMKGHTHVSKKNEWSLVASSMGFPKDCADDLKECYSTHLSLLAAYYEVARDYTSEELVSEMVEYIDTRDRGSENSPERETMHDQVGEVERQEEGVEEDGMHGIIEYDDGETIIVSFEGPQDSVDGEEDEVADPDNGNNLLMVD